MNLSKSCQISSMETKDVFLLGFVLKFVKIRVSEHLTFAKTICLPERCDIS